MSRLREAFAHARLAQAQMKSSGNSPGESCANDASRVIGDDARIGDFYIIRIPDSSSVRNERSLKRPAILWGIYRDIAGRIVAADFMPMSTQDPKDMQLGTFLLPGSERLSSSCSDEKVKSYVKANNLHTLADSYSVQNGGILRRRTDQGNKARRCLPDLIAIRAFNLLLGKELTRFIDPALDLSGTVREGVYFSGIAPCHVRDGRGQPDIADPDALFRHRTIGLPGEVSQRDVDCIAQWVDWYSLTRRLRKSGWPPPGAFRQPGWEGWGDLERNWRGHFKVWLQDQTIPAQASASGPVQGYRSDRDQLSVPSVS